MTQERWTEVDRYLAESLVRADPSLDAAVKASRASGLPSWDVSPTHGKLLYLIARLGGARSILEIGTLGGYSTIWLAKALPPGGQLIWGLQTLLDVESTAAIAPDWAASSEA